MSKPEPKTMEDFIELRNEVIYIIYMLYGPALASRVLSSINESMDSSVGL